MRQTLHLGTEAGKPRSAAIGANCTAVQITPSDRQARALTIEHGHARPAHMRTCGTRMTEQDDPNTVRLEGRFINAADTPPLTLRFQSVTYREPGFKDVTGADGYVMRSVIRQPSLIVSGLPADFRQAHGEWTHVVSSRLPNRESELVQVRPLDGDRAEIVVRYQH